MGEYEPNDSRNVTLNPNGAPGEPPRTGPREGQTRAPGQARPGQAELEQDERGDDPEANALADQAADAEAEAVLRKRSGEGEPPR